MEAFVNSLVGRARHRRDGTDGSDPGRPIDSDDDLSSLRAEDLRAVLSEKLRENQVLIRQMTEWQRESEDLHQMIESYRSAATRQDKLLEEQGKVISRITGRPLIEVMSPDLLRLGYTEEAERSPANESQTAAMGDTAGDEDESDTGQSCLKDSDTMLRMCLKVIENEKNYWDRISDVPPTRQRRLRRLVSTHREVSDFLSKTNVNKCNVKESVVSQSPSDVFPDLGDPPDHRLDVDGISSVAGIDLIRKRVAETAAISKRFSDYKVMSESGSATPSKVNVKEFTDEIRSLKSQLKKERLMVQRLQSKATALGVFGQRESMARDQTASELLEAQAAVQSLEKALEDVKAVNADVDVAERYDAARMELDTLRDIMEARTLLLERATFTVSQLENEVDGCREENANVQKRLEELQKTHRKNIEELASVQDSVAVAVATQASAKAEAEGLREDLRTALDDKTNIIAEVESLRQQVDVFTSKLSSADLENAKLEERVRSLESIGAQQGDQIGALSQREEKLKHQLQAEREEGAVLQERLESLLDQQKLTEQAVIPSVAQKAAELSPAVNLVTTQLSELQEECERLRSRLALSENSVESYRLLLAEPPHGFPVAEEDKFFSDRLKAECERLRMLNEEKRLWYSSTLEKCQEMWNVCHETREKDVISLRTENDTLRSQMVLLSERLREADDAKNDLIKDNFALLEEKSKAQRESRATVQNGPVETLSELQSQCETLKALNAELLADAAQMRRGLAKDADDAQRPITEGSENEIESLRLENIHLREELKTAQQSVWEMTEVMETDTQLRLQLETAERELRDVTLARSTIEDRLQTCESENAERAREQNVENERLRSELHRITEASTGPAECGHEEKIVELEKERERLLMELENTKEVAVRSQEAAKQKDVLSRRLRYAEMEWQAEHENREEIEERLHAEEDLATLQSQVLHEEISSLRHEIRSLSKGPSSIATSKEFGSEHGDRTGESINDSLHLLHHEIGVHSSTGGQVWLRPNEHQDINGGFHFYDNSASPSGPNSDPLNSSPRAAPVDEWGNTHGIASATDRLADSEDCRNADNPAVVKSVNLNPRTLAPVAISHTAEVPQGSVDGGSDGVDVTCSVSIEPAVITPASDSVANTATNSAERSPGRSPPIAAPETSESLWDEILHETPKKRSLFSLSNARRQHH